MTGVEVRRTRRLLPLSGALLGVLLLATSLSGCLSVPDSGPVHELRAGAVRTDKGAYPLNPRPPQSGAAPTEVVSGFLEAMLATPISTRVAKEYLTTDYAGSWDPSQRIITYTGHRPAQGEASTTVGLIGANWVDDRGAWRGALRGSAATLRFALAREHGQWRIAKAPNALVVPDWWFQTRYSQRNLYFFDPTARVLVPEPIFAPNGSQLATALVSSLLRGPGAARSNVDRTFLPAGSEGLSVPVIGHTAQINISGSTGTPSAHSQQLMAAQLAWTLRQDPQVEEIRLTIDGRAVKFPDSGPTFGVSSGMQYDPNGFAAGGDLYAVRRGMLEISSDGQPFTKVGGAWGQPHSVRAFAVDPTGNRAAGVTRDGRGLLVGPVVGKGPVTRASFTGRSLLRPAWDLTGRVWVVDRTPSGARVSYLTPAGAAGRSVVRVHIPGVSGANVGHFLVSRDGTRLVAAVRHRDGDQVVVSRLHATASGVITSAARAAAIPYPAQGTIRITDIAWRSPTTVAAVQQLPDTALVNVLTLDGATDVVPGATRSLVNEIDRLVGSPVSGTTLYARSGRSLIDLSNNDDIALARGTGTVSYAG